MASRSHTTFQKRQKEILRMEKQRDKAAKRKERNLAPKDPDSSPLTADLGEPLDGPAFSLEDDEIAGL